MTYSDIEYMFLKEKEFAEQKFGVDLRDLEYEIGSQSEIRQKCGNVTCFIFGCADENAKKIYYVVPMWWIHSDVIPHEIMHIVIKCDNITIEEELCNLYEEYRGYRILNRDCSKKVFSDNAKDCRILWERYEKYC